MSMPHIPSVPEGTINMTRKEVNNLLLASIAMEELALAHIVNAEAEKIQFVLGTLHHKSGGHPPKIDDLLEVNRAVGKILRDVIKKEMLLQFKLEEIVDGLVPHEHKC